MDRAANVYATPPRKRRENPDASALRSPNSKNKARFTPYTPPVTTPRTPRQTNPPASAAPPATESPIKRCARELFAALFSSDYPQCGNGSHDRPTDSPTLASVDNSDVQLSDDEQMGSSSDADNKQANTPTQADSKPAGKKLFGIWIPPPRTQEDVEWIKMAEKLSRIHEENKRLIAITDEQAIAREEACKRLEAETARLRAERHRRVEEKAVRQREEAERQRLEEERQRKELAELLRIHKEQINQAGEERRRREAEEEERGLQMAEETRRRQEEIACEEARKRLEEELRRQIEEEVKKRKEEEMLSEERRRVAEELWRQLEEERRCWEEERRRWEEEERTREEDERRRQEEEKKKEEERARLRQWLHDLEEVVLRQQRHQKEMPAAQVAAISNVFNLYEAKWAELKTIQAGALIPFWMFPWPSLLCGIQAPADVTFETVREFVLHPDRPNMQNKSAKERIRVEILRWHPDKFNALVTNKLHESQHEALIEAGGLVARWLNRLMEEP